MLLELPSAKGESVLNKTAVPSRNLPDSKLMRLSDLVRLLQKQNPQLEQARLNYIAAKTVVPQTLAPNNPQIGIQNTPMFNSPFNYNLNNGYTVSASQSFPFPGKKQKAANVADSQANFMKTQWDSLFIQLLQQVKTNYYQLQLLERQHEITQDAIRRLEQMKKIAKVRYAQNAGAFVDFLNAQVAQSGAEADLFGLERQIEMVRQTLNTLVGREPGEPLDIQRETPPQKKPEQRLAELEEMALKNHPNVRGADTLVKGAKENLDLSKLGYYPDFQVGMYYYKGNESLGFNPLNSWGMEFDVVVPLWFFTKEKYGIDQAKAGLYASQAGRKSIRQQVRLAVDIAHNALLQAIKQMDFIRSRQITEARTAYRLSLVNYANGTMPFINLLTAQSNLKSTELALIQSENQTIQAYTNLVAAVGSDI
jgi:outer membrane protein TolC